MEDKRVLIMGEGSRCDDISFGASNTRLKSRGAERLGAREITAEVISGSKSIICLGFNELPDAEIYRALKGGEFRVTIAGRSEDA
jgi:hypothetical protein